MKKLLQKIFRPFFVWLADRFASAPVKADVFKSLSKLYKTITTKKSSRGIVLDINLTSDNFIIFSDQHKGNKDHADDFAGNEINYIAALHYYHQQCFNYINLGDAEELWKYTPEQVLPKNKAALEAEANFQPDKKYYRTFGNHDLLWKNKLDVLLQLKDIFAMPLPVHEGIVLRTATASNTAFSIFLTHGHQGDRMSDNNRVSTWIIAHVWSPIQRFLEINVNTPSNDFYLRDKHNKLMYDWSSLRKNMLLITGHTHKPVFASGKYAEEEEHKILLREVDEKLKPSYFNTGCCCFNDGDITGIEVAGGFIRLIKWHTNNGIPQRFVLEEKQLEEIVRALTPIP